MCSGKDRTREVRLTTINIVVTVISIVASLVATAVTVWALTQ